jgi:hypothetical protein
MSFKQAIKDDVDTVFMNTEEFADIALFKGNEYPVQFLEQLDEESDSFYKLVIGKYEHFASAIVGDVLVVNGISYGIVDPKPDDLKTVMNMFLNEEI